MVAFVSLDRVLICFGFYAGFIEMKEQWRQRKQTTLTNTISLRQARELLLVKELKNNRDRKQTTLYMRSGAGSFLKVLLTNFDFLARYVFLPLVVSICFTNC
jgi:hypothetical protein